MLGEETVMISKTSPTFQKDIEAAKKAKKTIETYEEHGVGSKVTKGHNGIPEFMDSKKLKGEKKKKTVETKEWVENLAEEKFFHILTSKNEIMEMIDSKINEVNNSKFPEMFKWDSLKSMNGEIKESGTTTKPAPVKPKVDPGTKPKNPVIPKIIPKQRPKAERDPETGKIQDKPINPIGEPYKIEKGRKFNEPEEPKTNPKRKEEKKEKDHPVPQNDVNENGTKTAPVKPKVDPGTKPKKTVIPKIIPKQHPKALSEKKKD
jgi:hypothetical protein